MDYLIHYANGEESYLQHYGVLGMRWGVRHDKQYKAEKRSIKKDPNLKGGKNKAARKEAINNAKVKAANRLYSHNSESTNRKIQTRSTARTLGMTALYSSYGAMHYDRARQGDGYGRGKSAVRGLLAGYANNISKSVIPVMGIAGTHNYLKDRSARRRSQQSDNNNRGYL